jgi:PmbA protein
MTSPTLADLVRSIVERADPDEQVEVVAARGSSTTVRAWDGAVESLTDASSAGVGIRVLAAGREGFAHAGSLDAAVIDEVLAEARDNARFAEPDPWSGLAVADGVVPPDLPETGAEVRATPTDRKVDLALALERAATGIDPRVTRVRNAIYADSFGEVALASTEGIAVAEQGGGCHLAVSAMADDGTETLVGSGVDAGFDPEALDVEATAADAVEKAVRLFGAKPLSSRRVTIVLEPRQAAGFLGLLGGTLTGERVVKGRSPFADRLGEVIASDVLTLVDDPTDARSLAAERWDGEGLASRRNELVVDGVLRTHLHNSWTARRAGLASTASAVRGARSTPGVGCRALAVVPGPAPFDDLVADLDGALLVQSMTGWHSGVNAVSGDISVGAEGLVIRDGALAEPVREVTLATSLQRFLLDLVAVGGELEWLPGGTGSAALVVEGISLSGR